MPRKATSKASSRAKSRKQESAGRSKPKKKSAAGRAQAAISRKSSVVGSAAKSIASDFLGRLLSAVAGAITRKVENRPTRGGVTNRTPARKSEGGAARTTRVTRRDADIPMDRIAETYTPTQTSLKAGFRATGADRQRDQEFAGGFSDDRFNDEDRFTNKSGDPRIGTHGRTYEPGEARAKPVRDDED